ncbi:electron transfer flavoprotein subunit alpha/FixB family protein [Aquicella lusitana]|uniref:Electron transfer flavoprotein subunit alpha n=1 Tax=Aquicella lusitana TaxID=254246 RepID=A0A370GK59_9COXI|nr:FAD-binding protein [Aquicella lusitana]RDI43760.1 electron transfer flavoprotein alpha subunit apoprotein [Aquicella lusitana]VVC74509.1 Electron transfer flavoprotein subunit alpha [Aquicella lusitana]
MKILIIAEHDNQTLKQATHHTVTAAKKLGNEIDLLIMGAACQKVAEEARSLPAIQQVLLADNAVYDHQLAENCASLAALLAKEYDYILSGATTFGKNLLPRIAALLDVAMLSDVMQIISPDTFVRPIYAGNVLATVQSQDRIKILTIRTTSFPPVEAGEPKATIKIISEAIPNTLSRFENQTLTQSERPELTSARIVVSGGRGLKSAENFKLIEEIADRLGAAVGASRAAVDAGFAPNDYQVGQTGKVVAPDLYIAVGISGAIQHLAGMKDSKVIVAINNDPEAPIFQIADYALVGDLFKILPALRDELDKVLA